MDERERKNRKLGELWDGVARRMESPAEAGCPDSEILSAYFMHMLGKDETAQWEAHFSVCLACQEALAMLAKTASAEELALASEQIHERESADIGERLDAAAQLSRLSETGPVGVREMDVAAAPAAPRTLAEPVSVPRVANTVPRRRFTWRWLVPAVAGAAVFAVWLTLRLERTQTSNGVQIAENQPSPPPAAPNAAPNSADTTASPNPPVSLNKEKKEPLKPGAASVGGATTTASGTPQALAKKILEPPQNTTAETKAPRAADAVALGSKAAAANPAPQALPSGDDKVNRKDGRQFAMDKMEVPSTKSAAGDAGAFSQAAPSVQLPAEKSMQRAAAPDGRLQSEAAPGNAYRGENPPAVGRLNETIQVESAKAMARARNGAQFFAPGRRVAWSVGPGGQVLRSPDGGVSWIRQESGVTVDLLSGSSPSDTVCWVVGREGIVLLTTDGYHWSRLASPGTQDWTGVRATDALHAVIWDLNRAHRFSTSDGGLTWQGAAQ
jgi:hypothetical protein